MGDDFTSIHRIFSFETTKKEFSPSSSPLFDIKFKVLLETKQTQWIRNRDSTTYFAGQCKVLEYNVGVSLMNFLSEKQTYEEIDKALRRCGLLSEDERNRFMKYAWKQGWESLKSKPLAAFTTLILDFQLVLEQRLVGECGPDCVVEPLLRKTKITSSSC